MSILSAQLLQRNGEPTGGNPSRVTAVTKKETSVATPASKSSENAHTAAMRLSGTAMSSTCRKTIHTLERMSSAILEEVYVSRKRCRLLAQEPFYTMMQWLWKLIQFEPAVLIMLSIEQWREFSWYDAEEVVILERPISEDTCVTEFNCASVTSLLCQFTQCCSLRPFASVLCTAHHSPRQRLTA